jgi:hypothetical protein
MYLWMLLQFHMYAILDIFGNKFLMNLLIKFLTNFDQIPIVDYHLILVLYCSGKIFGEINFSQILATILYF